MRPRNGSIILRSIVLILATSVLLMLITIMVSTVEFLLLLVCPKNKLKLNPLAVMWVTKYHKYQVPLVVQVLSHVLRETYTLSHFQCIYSLIILLQDDSIGSAYEAETKLQDKIEKSKESFPNVSADSFPKLRCESIWGCIAKGLGLGHKECAFLFLYCLLISKHITIVSCLASLLPMPFVYVYVATLAVVLMLVFSSVLIMSHVSSAEFYTKDKSLVILP